MVGSPEETMLSSGEAVGSKILAGEEESELQETTDQQRTVCMPSQTDVVIERRAALDGIMHIFFRDHRGFRRQGALVIELEKLHLHLGRWYVHRVMKTTVGT